jgi:hypothetical protein
VTSMPTTKRGDTSIPKTSVDTTTSPQSLANPVRDRATTPTLCRQVTAAKLRASAVATFPARAAQNQGGRPDASARARSASKAAAGRASMTAHTGVCMASRMVGRGMEGVDGVPRMICNGPGLTVS